MGFRIKDGVKMEDGGMTISEAEAEAAEAAVETAAETTPETESTAD